MSTRSTIALEYLDGTIGQIYCHWDGYLSHNGKILSEHWTSPAKVQEMINLGDLSSLGVEIGEKHQDDTNQNQACTFYGRDWGEDNVAAREFETFQDYVNNHEYQEYEYILRHEGWYVSVNSGRYVPLSVALEQQL